MLVRCARDVIMVVGEILMSVGESVEVPERERADVSRLLTVFA
jgi:hypothetical protein